MTAELRQQLQSSLGSAYTLERELGGGGMSRTYVATEAALGRKVVVKILSPELAAGVSVERFKREIQLAAALQHPHVVPVLSSGEAAGLPWFTMPYVEGESLRLRVARSPLTIGETVSVLRDVARALSFAHTHGVVHRDIKPDNVLLSQGSATVTDFGIAKAISASRTGPGGATLTMAGTSIGTPTYMAPEQAAGDPNIDHRSDIYAFGVMAYELLTGAPPFQASSPAKLLGAHLGEKPRDVRELRPDAPETLAALVMRCLEKDPAARPQEASDLARVLDFVTSSGAATAAPAILQGGPMKLGRALVMWAVATVLVALTAWAATDVVGLPDWVFPGSLGVMLAGLPAIALTWYVQHAAKRAYTATPAFTPGGTASMQGTLATIALRASPHVSWRRTWMGGAVAVGAFVLLVVGFMVMRALGIGPAGSLMAAGKLGREERIIITDFASPASDTSLGLTITEALRADLAQSSALKVVPRLAVNETLRLMQRPANTAIDFAVAREIATREGVKAVLDGNIVSLGGRYVVSTRLVSAQSGEELAAFREEASSQNDLIPAISRLSKQLRAKVGESLKAVREASALERVTTGSMEALSKYAAALTTLEQTSDFTRAVPLLQQAVALDSTFAMAWRRLGQHYLSLGQPDRAREAVSQAYRFRERLSEVEQQLTIAAYFANGPVVDEEKALEAYEAALARDSVNLVALNNASILISRRREYERAAEYRQRAAAQDRTPNPITWANAMSSFVNIGRLDAVDSLLGVWLERMPDNPTALLSRGRSAYAHGDYDGAERLHRETRPLIASSRSATELILSDLSAFTTLRGRLRDAAQLRTEFRTRQAERGNRTAMLSLGMDSVVDAAVTLEDLAAARQRLGRVMQRTPPDSLPLIDVQWDQLLVVAALAGDAPVARRLHSFDRRAWDAFGRTLDREAVLAYDDGNLAFAEGRYADALAKYADADRKLLPCTECLASMRFLSFERLKQSDSAIAAGEAFVSIKRAGMLGTDSRFQPGIRQRLGELYEQKGNREKALEHYQKFADLWKNADAELQPRVRDVRGRIERLQAAIAKKG